MNGMRAVDYERDGNHHQCGWSFRSRSLLNLKLILFRHFQSNKTVGCQWEFRMWKMKLFLVDRWKQFSLKASGSTWLYIVDNFLYEWTRNDITKYVRSLWWWNSRLNSMHYLFQIEQQFRDFWKIMFVSYSMVPTFAI